jgi:hypothetical protein
MIPPMKDEKPMTRMAHQYITVIVIAVCSVVFLW